jgi:secondary thiamine-phosphate synthase enzyme
MEIITINFDTNKDSMFYDLTKLVKKKVHEKRIDQGILTIRTFHTTTSVFINENEKGLLVDLKKNLLKRFPKDKFYHHDDFSKRKINRNDKYGDRRNGFAHLMSVAMGGDVTISIMNGKLNLGQWQSIFFADFDSPREKRQVELIISE